MKKILFLAIVLIAMGCKSTKTNLKSNSMNLKNLHTEHKAVATQLLFEPTQGKVVSLQIAKNEQLKEHVTTIPALLLCVSGDATYNEETGKKIHLTSGDYVKIPVNVKHWVDAHELTNFLLIK
ncbi:hypothetical protein [Flavobacterium filum]|jgi:quercetin dioxygenase-like cupin family protein|uniref:hypothetical protein n=1 Tax=Flavobacterium TaxID=237 RepID=UPI00040E9C96|nr:hypothetical protein [Flavobacterium filum]